MFTLELASRSRIACRTHTVTNLFARCLQAVRCESCSFLTYNLKLKREAIIKFAKNMLQTRSATSLVREQVFVLSEHGELECVQSNYRSTHIAQGTKYNTYCSFSGIITKSFSNMLTFFVHFCTLACLLAAGERGTLLSTA